MSSITIFKFPKNESVLAKLPILIKRYLRKQGMVVKMINEEIMNDHEIFYNIINFVTNNF